MKDTVAKTRTFQSGATLHFTVQLVTSQNFHFQKQKRGAKRGGGKIQNLVCRGWTEGNCFSGPVFPFEQDLSCARSHVPLVKHRNWGTGAKYKYHLCFLCCFFHSWTNHIQNGSNRNQSTSCWGGCDDSNCEIE